MSLLPADLFDWDSQRQPRFEVPSEGRHEHVSISKSVTPSRTQAAGSKLIPPTNVPTPHTTAKVDAYNEADEPAYRYGYFVCSKPAWDLPH